MRHDTNSNVPTRRDTTKHVTKRHDKTSDTTTRRQRQSTGKTQTSSSSNSFSAGCAASFFPTGDDAAVSITTLPLVTLVPSPLATAMEPPLPWMPLPLPTSKPATASKSTGETTTQLIASEAKLSKKSIASGATEGKQAGAAGSTLQYTCCTAPRKHHHQQQHHHHHHHHQRRN
jgi:hypothetical protein